MPLGDFKNTRDLQKEEHLQAVLLAENFNDTFEPLTSDLPLALLPLVNTPLLDYSLDWLQRCDVNETIVYCCSQRHPEKVKEHCKRWLSCRGNSMEVKVVVSENCSSLGDAMRDLYSKSFLQGDFILLSGDVMGNLNLKELVNEHKAMREKERSIILSCVYINKSKKEQVLLDKSRRVNLVSSADVGKILMHSRASTSFSIPVEILQNYPRIKLNRNLEDPDIAICSDMIPSLFSDNFDYGTRDSLIQGVIEQEELMGYSIRSSILSVGYAAKVTSFAAYEMISRAVLNRICFPSVPERSLSSQRVRYHYQPFTCNYWDQSAKFYPKSIGDGVVVDAGSEISSSASIENTLIGKLCIIKGRVSIKNSFILSNVVINDGCFIDQSFIGNDVTLLPNVTLEPGVVIGNNVTLGPDIRIERSTRLSAKPSIDQFTGEPRNSKSDQFVSGTGDKAFICHISEEVEQNTVCWGKEELDEDSDVENSDLEDDQESSDKNDMEEILSSDEEREQEFSREVADSLLNAYRENSASTNVVLEVNASRHAYNASMEEVILAVTKCVICVDQQDAKDITKPEQLRASIKKGIHAFGDVLSNYIRKGNDQITMLRGIEQLCEDPKYIQAMVPEILLELNQEMEILDDHCLIDWYDKKGIDKELFKSLNKVPRLSAFIDWLKQSSEEEDSE